MPSQSASSSARHEDRKHVAKAIMKRIEQLSCKTGRWYSQIFCDLVEATRQTLLMLPVHAQSLASTGRLAMDDEENQEFFKQLKDTYKQEGLGLLSESMALLIDGADGDFQDHLGDLYMEIRSSGHGKMLGQYFTPDAVAIAMSAIVLSDAPDLVTERLRAAGTAAELASDEIEILAAGPDAGPSWLELFMKCRPHFKPVTMAEPSCGSGIMILAAARQFPLWAHRFGLVQFHLNDLDRTCAGMAHCNMLLNGLTAVVTCGNALTADPPEQFGTSPAQFDRRIQALMSKQAA